MKPRIKIPSGVICLLVIVLIFGYLAYVMGLANMLNTMMKTAHDLLLNTVFYLMGICVLTGALGKIFVEFGVVDMLQRLLRPVMKPLFNLPGVASLGAVLTFLSDNPAIITLSQDRKFARYFKKYQFISLTNFGTAFGMGLIVIVFMIGQGYMAEPFIGLVGAMCGCVISTRLMQHFVCKDYPQYREEDAVTVDAPAEISSEAVSETSEAAESTFVRILNSLLDGGKSGVDIGLAIIPGVLIISTFVMMLTFGASSEGVDEAGNAIAAYSGAAYEGTKLLPWLASKISFIFKWLFGFTAPELISFPITALGAVGAALGLIPQFSEQGIIDGNAIAVFTAMGMCWSGYLSTHTAMLDSLGYRKLLSRAFLSHFLGGIGAGIAAHWLYAGIVGLSSLFAPSAVWTAETSVANVIDQPFKGELVALDDGTYKIEDWYGAKGTDLIFSANADSTISIRNAYAEKDGKYFFVQINEKALPGEVAYACFYPGEEYSKFDGDSQKGYCYAFIFIYDPLKRMLDRGFYEITWGGIPRQAENLLDEEEDTSEGGSEDSSKNTSETASDE